MRSSLLLLLFASSFTLAGCYESTTRAPGLPDAHRADDAGAGCSCRSGTFHVEGAGLGARTDVLLGVRDCDGRLACTIDGEPRSCYTVPSEGSLRVHIDEAGYVQLVFHAWSCRDEWAGGFASEAGGYPLTAIRQR
jgi:hypothetical protein